MATGGLGSSPSTRARALPLASRTVLAASGKERRTRAAIIVSARDMSGRNAGAGTSSGMGKDSTRSPAWLKKTAYSSARQLVVRRGLPASLTVMGSY